METEVHGRKTALSTALPTRAHSGSHKRRWRDLIDALLGRCAATASGASSATPRRHSGGDHDNGWRNMIGACCALIIATLAGIPAADAIGSEALGSDHNMGASIECSPKSTGGSAVP